MLLVRVHLGGLRDGCVGLQRRWRCKRWNWWRDARWKYMRRRTHGWSCGIFDLMVVLVPMLRQLPRRDQNNEYK